MAIRSTAIIIPAGSCCHVCCPRSSLVAAEELMAALAPISEELRSQPVDSLHKPSCPLQSQPSLCSALAASHGTFATCSSDGFMADMLRCPAAWRPADRSATSAAAAGLASILASAGWHSEQLAVGVTGVCNDPIWPLSYSPGCRGPPQTSVCRAAKPRFLLNRYIKVAAWGLGWWDQSNQDAAEKAVPALVVRRTNPFASLWKRNLPLSFCSV